MSIGNLLGKTVRVVRSNPEIALALLGFAAPKAAAKIVAVAVKVKAVREVVR